MVPVPPAVWRVAMVPAVRPPRANFFPATMIALVLLAGCDGVNDWSFNFLKNIACFALQT